MAEKDEVRRDRFSSDGSEFEVTNRKPRDPETDKEFIEMARKWGWPIKEVKHKNDDSK